MRGVRFIAWCCVDGVGYVIMMAGGLRVLLSIVLFVPKTSLSTDINLTRVPRASPEGAAHPLAADEAARLPL